MVLSHERISIVYLITSFLAHTHKIVTFYFKYACLALMFYVS